jgi:murein DD-endopeptidase MepM/ murein hydrolase activator NlpD
MKQYLLLICIFVLASCSTSKIPHKSIIKEPAKQILAQTTKTLTRKYNIKNPQVVLLYGLDNKTLTNLTNNNYINIINSSKYNQKFLLSFQANQNNLEMKAKQKLALLNQLLTDLKKNKIHVKYYPPKLIKNHLAELAKIHNKVGRFLPIFTPSLTPRITSTYGIRRHPITRKQKFHHGLDLASTKHMICAAADGTVTKIERRKDGYGNNITIDHHNGFKTFYAHLDKILISKNQKVIQGELIAVEGKSGAATGIHLHFETIYKNKKINPILLLKHQF